MYVTKPHIEHYSPPGLQRLSRYHVTNCRSCFYCCCWRSSNDRGSIHAWPWIMLSAHRSPHIILAIIPSCGFNHVGRLTMYDQTCNQTTIHTHRQTDADIHEWFVYMGLTKGLFTMGLTKGLFTIELWQPFLLFSIVWFTQMILNGSRERIFH